MNQTIKKRITLINIKLFTVGREGYRRQEGKRHKGKVLRGWDAESCKMLVFVIYLCVEYFQIQEPKMLCLFWCRLRLVSQDTNEIHTWAENVLAFGEIASPFLCLQNRYIMGHKM